MAGPSNYTAIPVVDDDTNEINDNNSAVLKGYAKPAVVFCIDGSENMFSVTDGETDVPILMCLQCIRQTIQSYIFSPISCDAAIVVTGTAKTENTINLKNMTTIAPLRPLNAEIVKAIDDLISKIADDSYRKEFGFTETTLYEALWLSATLLTQMKGKTRKNVIFFTKNEDPFRGVAQERVRSFAALANYESWNIQFTLIPIGKSFNVNKHFKELLEMNGGVDITITPHCLIESMIAQSCIMRHRNFASAKLPFQLSDNVQIPVAIHYVVRQKKKPFSVKLSKATNDVVVRETHLYSEETGEEINREQLIQSHKVGGEAVRFTAGEIHKMKRYGERQLKLLGFKPMDSLSLELHSKATAFVYPGFTKSKGVRALFGGLVERCLAKQVVAICTLCPRPTSSVNFVALVPQKEQRSAQNIQTRPPGFILVYLPFGDEVRDWDESCTNKERASPEQVDLVKKIVKKLSFPYDPKLFSNPSLTNHWAGVEALALGSEFKSVNDNTLPDYENMRQRLNDLTLRFKNEIYSEEYDVALPIPKKKPETLPVDVAFVENYARRGNLTKLKLDQLKGYLKAVGRSAGISKMKKNDLIDTINDYLKLS